MPTDSIHILLITGPVGVGKSTVADEVFEILRKTSTPIALVNFDELTYASPLNNDPHGTKLGLKNLSAIWQNYYSLGIRNLIIPYVIEDQEEIERFRSSAPGSVISVVRLSASTKTLHERLRARQLGGSLEWHLERADELNSLYANNNLGNIIINTDNKTIHAVAEEVISTSLQSLIKPYKLDLAN